MELLEAVPGTLILKTLHPVRYLAIPVELVEVVPGTDGSLKETGCPIPSKAEYRWLAGPFRTGFTPAVCQSDLCSAALPGTDGLRIANQRLTISDQPCGIIGSCTRYPVSQNP